MTHLSKTKGFILIQMGLLQEIKANIYTISFSRSKGAHNSYKVAAN